MTTATAPATKRSHKKQLSPSNATSQAERLPVAVVFGTQPVWSMRAEHMLREYKRLHNLSQATFVATRNMVIQLATRDGQWDIRGEHVATIIGPADAFECDTRFAGPYNLRANAEEFPFGGYNGTRAKESASQLEALLAQFN